MDLQSDPSNGTYLIEGYDLIRCIKSVRSAYLIAMNGSRSFGQQQGPVDDGNSTDVDLTAGLDLSDSHMTTMSHVLH